MDTIQSIQWLKANNLYELAQETSFQLKKVFAPCLNITEEKILIMGDKGFSNKRIAPVMSGAYYLAARSMNMDTKLTGRILGKVLRKLGANTNKKQKQGRLHSKKKVTDKKQKSK